MKRLLPIVFLLWAAPAWAITVVQCTTLVDATVTNTSLTASNPFSTNPTVGNYIITVVALVQLGGAGTGVTSITDNVSGSNIYTVDVQKTRSDSLVFNSISSGKVAVSGGTFKINVNYVNQGAGNAMAIEIMACEVSGLATSSVKDKTATNEVISGTSLTVTAAQNSQQSEIVFAGMAGANLSGTLTSGYTSLWNSATNVGSGAGDKIVSACESSSATGSFSSADEIGVIATYKGSTVVACSGGSASGTPLTTLHAGK